MTVRRGFNDYGWLDLRGVRNHDQIQGIVDLLRSTIFVDLTPEVDECYALGPYTVFTDEDAEQSELGQLVNRGKYWRDNEAVNELGRRISNFAEQHPTLGNVQALASPPKSDPSTPNLAGSWAEQLGRRHDWDVIPVRKIRETEPQKSLGEGGTEDDATSRIVDSAQVDQVLQGARVLILDDTIRSGGTIKELARALRRAGAGSIYALAAAKDARFTNGGVQLDKVSWS